MENCFDFIYSHKKIEGWPIGVQEAQKVPTRFLTHSNDILWYWILRGNKRKKILPENKVPPHFVVRGENDLEFSYQC